MEWVETTAKTVEAAKELALDRLGVDETDAEFEILEEPRPGLFGRVKGEARVRARVRPTRPRPKTERRDRKRRTDKPDAPAKKKTEPTMSDTGAPKSASDDKPAAAQPTANDVAAEAVRFIDGLLEALGLEGSATVDQDGTELEVRVEGG